MDIEELETNWYEEMEKRAKTLDQGERELAAALLELSRCNYIHDTDKEYQTFIAQLQAHGGGEPGQVSEPLQRVVQKLFSPYTAAVTSYIMEHATEYPNSQGYSRRPYRNGNLAAHLPKILNKLNSLLFMERIGLSLESHLKNNNKEDNYQQYYRIYMVLADVIAYELDRSNNTILELLKEMVYGDNQASLLSQDMLRGMVMCHRPDVAAMLGELLLAARLQEGLRQSIVEKMDEGTLENNLYLLKLIIDHEFIRFSSVVRAVGVWTGMGLEAQNQRVAQSIIEEAYQVLTDEALREQWRSDSNANHVYLSLWATAMHEESDLPAVIEPLMAEGRLYQKIIAQYVLGNSQNQEVRLASARMYLHEQDPELLNWVLNNYAYSYDKMWRASKDDGPAIEVRRTPQLEDKTERRRDFLALQAMVLNSEHREVSGQSKVLDFLQFNYSTEIPLQKMLYLAAYDMDSEWIAEMILMKEQLSGSVRADLLQYFITDPEHPMQREFIFASLADKSIKNRELAVSQATPLTLSQEELIMAEGLLKLKTGSLRQGVTLMLLNQPDESLQGSIARLLQGKHELQRLAALELVTVLFEGGQRIQLYEAVRPLVDSITSPSAKERELLLRLEQKNEYTRDNGFGLYQPGETEAWLSEGPLPGDFRWDQVFRLTMDEVKQFVEGLNAKIHEHREFEYEAEFYGGHKEKMLLGTELRPTTFTVRQDGEETATQLEQYPLHEVWSAYLKESGWDSRKLLELKFHLGMDDLNRTMERYYRFFRGEVDYGELSKIKLMEGWRREFTERLYPVEQIAAVKALLEKQPYSRPLHILIHAFVADHWTQENFTLANGALNALMEAMLQDNRAGELAMLNVLGNPWISMMWRKQEDLETFRTRFRSFYTFDRLDGGVPVSSHLSLEDFFRAYEDGLIGEGEVFKELLSSPDSRNHMRNMTSGRHDIVGSSVKLREIRTRTLERLLEIELKRGDLPTEVTALVMSLERIEGMEYFIRILAGLDKETFIRGYLYGYGDSFTKKESFSNLLKISHPREGEDAELLKGLLKQLGISDKRLLEAAMYAPQWIEIVAAYLGWEGLRSAAWYFHAHINESFSAEKETVVAHYSPITPQDFNDGAFDVNWFQDAYHTLGQERFELLYECAKYISAGANHRRSQLFADATLGKLKLEEMKVSAAQKRNKDHLLSYSLIPLGKQRDRDLRERYEFIQQFLAESKKFGAQRRASEALSVRIALGNLARNAGYADVTRLMWDIEARKLDELEPYFAPYALDEDTTAVLQIDAEGQSELAVTSKGKVLKSVPARFKKHPHIETLKEIRSELTAQYRRARLELERSMESASAFTLEEISGLARNPILAPLLLALVLKSSTGTLGYFDPVASALNDPAGKAAQLEPQEKLYIAHPLDLYNSGQWSLFQKDLFDRQLRQPFKQIFRELYLPNADELANVTGSRRYAGHQVQPNKTVALLRGRQWTVSYEEGLQKVFYGENLIVRLYAQADWFSPADTEAPALETVQFFDRKTYKEVPLDQVPPLVFSEVMRDIDLVVSVAHVGGVDPEASLTTVEMRSVIVKESLRLLKLDNVSLDGNYARIAGSLGEYAVHLGSGMVYKQATGALHIIAVHSQHRGRLFLPFLDEDPRTAEILSKIVLLAEDKKIKDPQILMQLQ
ncbi:DUF4132 domain-containing protein [Paenibacillus donghaensis]|uniref:DUF4132 domain-containing protein n=1 Tax=Paenibacillus donghaensis TaxID=414771 RepID=A0A2Z2KRR5_9BACL|nr:hypothetical protein B9T62_37395 [Paenibacillus donghaensis]